ncbi:MAG: NADP-dependent oxidoreductase [Pseudomonadota bacterium]
MTSNACIKLASKATGEPTLENFTYTTVERPTLGEGEALIRIDWISVDPYMITRIKARENYHAAVEIGDVMQALAVGEVIESNREDRKVGDAVMGEFGMQSFAVDGPKTVSRVLDAALGSPRLSLTLLGLIGLTAYSGLLEIGRPVAGETVLISAGAGAVATVAAAIAKVKDCKTVAVVGSEAKVKHCVEHLPYDAAVSRNAPDFPQKLATACPNGVDVFFDNTGGPIYDEALKVMNIGGRIIGCGRIAAAKHADPAQDIGPRDTDAFIVKRLMKKGLLVGDYEALFPKALSDLAKWHAEGKIPLHEDILEGIENAPEALMRLVQGRNLGKQLVRVVH